MRARRITSATAAFGEWYNNVNSESNTTGAEGKASLPRFRATRETGPPASSGVAERLIKLKSRSLKKSAYLFQYL